VWSYISCGVACAQVVRPPQALPHSFFSVHNPLSSASECCVYVALLCARKPNFLFFFLSFRGSFSEMMLFSFFVQSNLIDFRLAFPGSFLLFFIHVDAAAFVALLPVCSCFAFAFTFYTCTYTHSVLSSLPFPPLLGLATLTFTHIRPPLLSPSLFSSLRHLQTALEGLKELVLGGRVQLTLTHQPLVVLREGGREGGGEGERGRGQ